MEGARAHTAHDVYSKHDVYSTRASGSSVSTPNMGQKVPKCTGGPLGLAPWPRLLPGIPPLAPLAMGPSVGHMGSSTVRIRTFLHTIMPQILISTFAHNEPYIV